MTYAPIGVDFALVATFLFFGFFVGLIFYLRREDRREGFPLEEDDSGRVRSEGGFLFIADPKTFRLPFGRGTVTVPNDKRDRRAHAAKRSSVVPGSPSDPVGNPMTAGVGPGSYAERAKVPDLTAHGDPRIVPLRVAKDFNVAAGDLDPRGFAVLGTDGGKAGAVKELWVDRGESMVRYLEVELSSGQIALLPITMALINKRRKSVEVDAITAAQFVDVPKLERPDQITFDEEERVAAYYGAGFLYATPARLEPLI
jgi:photosynthetic reaction center H subunit